MNNKITTRKARWLRRLSWVPRWAVVPTIHKQNVAEHSFHVSVLALWLVSLHARGDDGNFKLDVLLAAMQHDADEARSGDAPSPYKDTPLDTEDQVEIVVKCADKLEALLFIEEERRLGNRMGMDAIEEYLTGKFKEVWELFDFDNTEWFGHKPPAHNIVSQACGIAFNHVSPHPALEGEPYEH